jgi:transposase InsO family protein
MKAHQSEFRIERMSSALNLSRSGYYRFIKAPPSRRTQANEQLTGKIHRIFKDNRCTYGSPRIRSELQAQGETCSRKRVARLMKQAGLAAKMKARFKCTTQQNPKAQAAPNLLQQNFSAKALNQVWVADITYIPTWEGWLYVATVLDLFSRRIVGLAMRERMTAALVVSAVNQAVTHRKPEPGLIHHSDRGSQYTSEDFQKLLKAKGLTASMSGTGCCFDNAAAESFFHTLKTEHVYFEDYQTREEAKLSIFEYVEAFYNRTRRHSTLGYVSPAMFEQQWGMQ